MAGMRWVTKVCLIGILTGLFSLAVPGRDAVAADRWADLETVVFKNYGREDGLPPLVPTALAQDGHGFLWIGTQGGIVRWDGYRFREYDAGSAHEHGLPGTWIRVLHADKGGRLWVGTDVDGLAYYDPDSDRFVPVSVAPGEGGADHIGAIGDDGAGGLWVGTDKGLYHLDVGKASGPVSRHHEGDPWSLPGDKIEAVLIDRQGRLWVGTDGGVARWDPLSKGFERVPFTGSPNEAIAVSVLFEDQDGRMWVGTTQHGVYVVAPQAHVAERLERSDSLDSTLLTDRVSAIVAAGNHEVWVAMRTAGIVAYDLDTSHARRIRHDKLVPGSLAHDDVWTMCRDDAGSIWIGGMGGLSYRPRDLGTVSTLFGDTGAASGITDPDVSSVLATKDGRIWLGFLNGGVDIIDPVVGRIARIQPDSARPDVALPNDLVTSMAEVDDDTLYLGTVRGTYRVNQHDYGVALARLPDREAQGYVRALHVADNTLWIGGPAGLYGLPLTGEPQQRRLLPIDSSQMTDQSILSILGGTSHDLWIGTYNGLNRLDLLSGQIERIVAESENATGLPGRLVSSLLFDRQGRLWVGTFGGGVAVLVGRAATGRPLFHRIGLGDGLPDLNVDSLQLDASGIVWASTDDGLAAIDPVDFKASQVRRADGAPLTVYLVRAGAADLFGEPLFGAKGGLSVVHPGWPRTWDFQPPIVVSDVRIGGNEVSSSRFNISGLVQPLVLTPEANTLAVEFSALDFTAPEQNRYAYRLDPFDRDWINTDAARRLAAYTNLPPGDYTLKLRGSNRSGVWAEHGLEIPIRVLPAWYQTLEARLVFAVIAAATVLAVIAAVVRSRTAFLRRYQADLERQIATRTADLRAANDRLSEFATTDPLTGCANRRHFMERAHGLVVLGRRGVPVSLAVIDLDHFKSINDRYGHPIGDEMLRAIGRSARETIRETDVIGRIGGEEFALLMPNTNIASAYVLADRLRAALAETEVSHGDLSIRVTASLGLAELREVEDFNALYTRADSALYAAKQGGRNRVIISEAPGAIRQR